MKLPTVSETISYVPEAALLQLESLKMFIKDYACAYPTDIPATNEYLLEYHAELVQHITVLLKDHYTLPVDLPHLSLDTSSFTTSLPSEIPSKGPNSVPFSTHKNYS